MAVKDLEERGVSSEDLEAVVDLMEGMLRWVPNDRLSAE